MEIESERPLAHRIDATLFKKEQYGAIASFSNVSLTDEDNVYVSRTMPLSGQPETPLLTMDRLFIKSDVSFSFQTDTRDFGDSDEMVKTIDETLGTYNHTTVTLKEKTYTSPDQLKWTLSLDKENESAPHLSNMPFQPVTNMFGFTTEAQQHVTVENRSDEDTAAFLTRGPEGEMRVHSEQSRIGEDSPVTFTLSNLTDTIPFQIQSEAKK
ncbi:hypothetical protein U0355_13560 [Salimicrobium sp. PL1-032A]|uniref:hypothetical protein n=1 Tax=Salimicrobium sp. PL1-032A TaxID=3095364 RepID=UPI003260B5E2